MLSGSPAEPIAAECSSPYPDLITSIETDLDVHNNNPKPIVWAATAHDILAGVNRGRAVLQAVNQA